MLVKEAIEKYIKRLRRDGSSAAHIKAERWRCELGLRPWLDAEIGTIGRAMLNEHLGNLQGRYAEATMSGVVQSLKALFRFAKKRRWAKNVASHLKRGSFVSKVSKAAPEMDVQMMRQALAAFLAARKHRPRDVRDALFVSLSLDCGGRLGGLAFVRWSDVRQALNRPKPQPDGSLVYHVETFSKRKWVVLRFLEETAGLFRLWDAVRPRFPNEPDKVFTSLKTGEPLLDTSASRAFDRVCKFAGVPIHRSHSIRHRNVTELRRVTGDVKPASVYAGHAGTEVTQRHYNEVVSDEVDAAVAAVARRRQHDSDNDAEMRRLFGLK